MRKSGDILNALNQAVTATLQQHREHSTLRDGMDIALCCFDFKNYQMNYAGANNPLFIIRNEEILTFDPVKAPIGAFVDEKLKRFSSEEISLQKGDVCYIFSDGYADQFGGPDNKKFLKRNFRELLQSIYKEPMQTQKELLEQKFENWRGHYEQIDDILVIGIKII
jgi:serine phosphatase RsbU (regulator of sigma subunit)